MTDLFSGSPQTPPTSRRDRRRQQRRKAERRKNFISFLVMIGALVLLVGGAWIFIKPMIAGMGQTAGPEDYPGPGSGATEVVVAEGDTGSQIGATLLDAGVVKSIESFNTAYEANASARNIQAGTYELPLQMRAADAVAALLDSSYRVDVQITIPEGWSATQVFERISDYMDVPIEEVDAAAETVGETLPDAAENNLEGWLAPATYTAGPGDTAEDVLTQMVEGTKSTLRSLGVEPEDQQELLIKASIVEKEVPAGEYRGKVARVIENRLEGCSGDGTLGMDTTVVYAFGKPYEEITDAELESSEYNTRKHPGLPPTPIGSPSGDSIEAVLDPPEGNWCYFVTVNLETMETLFTDNIEEHDKNWAKYREYLEQLREDLDD